MIWPIVFGFLGCAILIVLGIWQVQCLTWKEGIFVEMEACIGDAFVALPAAPDQVRDRFLPVTAIGMITSDGVFVMAFERGFGVGYWLIAAFEIGDRRILIDCGFILAVLRDVLCFVAEDVTIIGNLYWLQDANFSILVPDCVAWLWFVRKLFEIAAFLGTEPVLVVLCDSTEPELSACFVPLDIAGILNNHLNYAIIWFLLAFVWVGMIAFLLWRIRQQTV